MYKDRAMQEPVGYSQGCENVALYLHESTYAIEMMELELWIY